MDSLQELLAGRGPIEPEAIQAIKRYIFEQFGAEASVGVQGEAYLITVGSASLANTLRLRLPALQAAANTEKRLILRIG